jgi:hypothetical protein
VARPLVRSVNKKKAVKLTGKLNELDDVATNYLSSDILAEIDMVAMETSIHSNKSYFYAYLYE